jgi:hypothetical protein
LCRPVLPMPSLDIPVQYVASHGQLGQVLVSSRNHDDCVSVCQRSLAWKQYALRSGKVAMVTQHVTRLDTPQWQTLALCMCTCKYMCKCKCTCSCNCAMSRVASLSRGVESASDGSRLVAHTPTSCTPTSLRTIHHNNSWTMARRRRPALLSIQGHWDPQSRKSPNRRVVRGVPLGRARDRRTFGTSKSCPLTVGEALKHHHTHPLPR